MTMKIKSRKDKKLPGNTAADKLALLNREEELREKKEAKIASFNKKLNATQERDLAALKASDIDFAKDPEAATKARELLSKLPEIPPDQKIIHPSGITQFELNVTKNGYVWVETGANRYLIAKPHLGRSNDNFMGYITNRNTADNAVHPITRNEIISAHDGQDIIGKKRFHVIVHELGFRGTIKQTFFPQMTDDSTLFRKKVAVQQLSTEGINAAELVEELEARHLYLNPKQE